MNTNEERKNKQIAGATTIVVNALLMALLFFSFAWRAPDPPLPEFGIQLNFGVDLQGGGDIQPTEEAGAQPQQEQTEETPQEPQPEAREEVTEATEVASKTESPVTVKETPKETVKEPVKEEKKPEPKKEEKPKVDSDATYKSSEKTDNATKTGKDTSQGDDAGKQGDKGDPKGSLDADALYGKQGGGQGGSSLDLAGWKWDAVPKPDVPNNESGRLVFEIKVDENGEIISIKTIERSVSLETEKICRAEIEGLTFSKTGSNVPSVSTGRITFVVRSK